MTARLALPAGVLGVATALAVATGCGVQSDDPGPDRTSAVTTSTVVTTVTTPLPQRPAGVIAGDIQTGNLGLNLAGILQTQYQAQSDNRVQLSSKSQAAGFTDLCAGNVDFVATSGEPTPADLAACKARGLEIAGPIELASEAVVLATKNGSDVGGDCITVRQARDIFRSGSQYTNWSQLGFDNLTLRTTGRNQGSDNFRLFGQIVLGTPDPTIADVRADYVARLTDQSERETITGARVRRLAEARIAAYRKNLIASTRKARQNYVNAAIAQANRRALKVIAAVNAANKRKKIVVNAPKLIAANARFVARVKTAAAIRANAAFDRRLNRQLRRYSARQLRGTGQRGFIGPFRYSYYGLFEEELRPMEIDFGVPETLSGQPVQLQDLTPADQAAVTKDILAATGGAAAAAATTAGATAGVTTTSTTSGTATTSTTSTTATTATLPPTTVVPPLDNLPATTKDGEKIYTGPNCVFPSQLTITNGSYPLTRRSFIYTTKQALKRAEVRDLLTFLVNNAQALATQKEQIPITDFQVAQNLAIIQGRPAPTPAAANGGEAVITTSTTSTTSTTPRATSTTPTTTTPSTTTTTTTGATPSIPGPSSSGIPGVSNRRVSSDQ